MTQEASHVSIEDGVLAYALEGSFRPYPYLASLNLKRESFRPAEGEYCHIRDIRNIHAHDHLKQDTLLFINFRLHR